MKHFVVHSFWLGLTALVLAACGGDGGPCAPGSRNCACQSGGPSGSSCQGAGLACIQGVCRACENGSCIPAAPKCYSPCNLSFLDKSGNFRVCSDEGLMDGCLAGTHCDNGSCKADPGTVGQPIRAPLAVAGADGGARTAPEREPGTCAMATDCPQHQVCILGNCYSECDTDEECQDGSICQTKVCRQVCGDGVPCKGAGYTCRRLGNTKSVCEPQAESDGELGRVETTTVPGSYSLQRDAACAKTLSCEALPIAFNTSLRESAFVIANQSAVARTFQVAKAAQTQVGPGGMRQVFRADRGENPLPWIELGTPMGSSRTSAIDVTVPANGQVKVTLKNARNPELPRWEGTLDITSPRLGPTSLELSYSERVPGRWSGQIYYFGNFGDHTQGQDQLSDWIADKNNLDKAQKVPNAFIRTWANFRAGNITSAEMGAVVDSILTGSWDFARVKELCAQVNGGVCAPFAGGGNRSVVSITADAKTAPVPSGVVELGVTLNLGEGSMDMAACGGSPTCFAGRIESREALQYPNDPRVVVKFANDPTQCTKLGELGCVSSLAQFSSEMVLGARFRDPTAGTRCPTAVDFGTKQLPWLVPGMLRDSAGARLDAFFECRDGALPFAGNQQRNVELAAANPVPDGLQRRRKLELVDGILLEQKTMLVIFKETLESFLGGSGDVFTSYGYMSLTRQNADLKPGDVTGQAPSMPSATRSRQPLEAACPKSLIDRTFPISGYPSLSAIPSDKRNLLVGALLDGSTSDTQLGQAVDTSIEEPHYLCTWTELVASIGGQPGTGTPNAAAQTIGRAKFDTRCPPYARVVYFTLTQPNTILRPRPDDAACIPQTVGNVRTCEATCNGSNEAESQCDKVLKRWAESGKVRLALSEKPSFPTAPSSIFNLTWACQDPSRPVCDDYGDLTAGKKFFANVASQPVFNPLRTDIKEAFRYKFQFQNRAGQNIGFAPTVCDASSRLVPYCYDPNAILDTRDRVDCAIALYDDHVKGTSTLQGTVAERLRDYLRENFGFIQIDNPLGDPRVVDGFERLFAELMVMLGDDAYTASFASRFDLAGTQILGFEGASFEAGGINLSGVAGHEMYKLYQASQYYQLVLDRFFAQTPRLWANLENPDQRVNGFLSNKTVSGYLTRVIRASSQLSNAANQIARRYQAFNRPDLARRVIERGYARSYLESQILSQFMRRVEQVVPGDQQDEVIIAVRDAERQYRVAMLDMRNAYKRITDDQTIFGFAPDYIPFPALSEKDTGAFPVILARAKERMAVADGDETRALQKGRSFETDSAAFQSELVKIRTEFERQLGDKCGTFTGADGKVYPAVARYKHLDARFDSLVDPCGYERGEIWVKVGDIANADSDLRKMGLEARNLQAQGHDLIEKIKTQCRITKDTADATRNIQNEIDDCQSDIDQMETASIALSRVIDAQGVSAQVDVGVSNLSGAYDELAYLAAAAIAFTTQTVLDTQINDRRNKIRNYTKDKEQTAAYAECEQFAAEGAYELYQIQRDVLVKNLDILTGIRNLDTAISELQQLINEQKRLESEWEDSNQLTINVEAARNDPNVRIYKNDAIINADLSFTSAVREAYRATKVFEYYTGQSYAALDKLFLVRMVNAGDQNLKQYLTELEDAFFEFEEQFGKPATRVAIISVRDRIFKVPFYAEGSSGLQLSLDDRVNRFRTALMDEHLVDNDGNIVIPFQTDFSQLSPLTNDHKILFIEASIESADHGDDVARLYLRQLGSSAIVNAGGQQRFYAFPPRTAVLNPLFPTINSSGRQAFDTLLGGPTASIFRDYRFRDRPFVNSNWQLVFNPRTEEANKDVKLSSVDDIKLYVYYTDFSNL